MKTGTDLLRCNDPLVQQVLMQRFAIDLIERGLLPKQICIITDLPIKKVKELRTGMLPVDQRRGRPTKSAATMLRKAEDRAAASIFISIYRNLSGPEVHWPHFLKAYDIYTALSESFSGHISTIPIEDAFTLVSSLQYGIITVETCHKHGVRFLTLTSQDRGWRCPYCTLDDEHLKAQTVAATQKLGETEPHLGFRAANTTPIKPDTMRG